MNKKNTSTCIAALLAISLSLANLCVAQTNDAGAEKLSWKAEFERLCAQTETASTLPDQQIRDLINDSDALLKKLESLEDSQVRVYVFRLKKCKAFFEFTLELNQTE